MSWLPNLPHGWPWSLWFLIATAAVYLLQRFPYTGIFLMIVAAPFWSVILVNLGVIGIGLEALAGRVSRLWLVLPLIYFGGYYLFLARERSAFAQLQSEIASGNAGKSLPFEPATRDLVIEKVKGDFHPSAADLVQRYAVPRAFEESNVYLIGDAVACELVRKNEVYRSAGIYATGFYGAGRVGVRKMVPGHCSIRAPAQPDRPVVRVLSEDATEKRGTLPVRINRLRIVDEAGKRQVELRAGTASLLKRFPMPVMGCGLNSGAASWDCFAGFMRDRATSIAPGGASAPATLAAVLGLKRSDDHASRASGVELVRAFGEAADAKLIDKEMAVLERMLAQPMEHHKDSWFWHLPNRPDVIAPHAGRIFAALRTLQGAEANGSETGRNLWRLVAALPEEALAPYRREMVEWLKPHNARPWTEQTGEVFTRLDGSEAAEREILLHRLETKRGDLQTDLLASFCRMGAAAPDEVKRRLLALWHKRGEASPKRDRDRPRYDVPLYFTLARLRLKQGAGKVEQRYFGPTFLGIWDEVTPEFPDALCSGSINDISNHFKRRARERSSA